MVKMIFKQMIEQCGLDRQAAAAFLGYSLGSIKKWITGERVLPDDVIAKMAVLNDLINKNANRIASDLLNKGTAIDDQTIHFLEGNLPDLPDLPSNGAKDACLARTVLIAASKQLATVNDVKSEQ
ncbi:MAG: hypothetical protein [Bacteriophage sp.]|nr:MAG: hypothetical protein [Bacteriophage sp.]